MPSLNLAAVVFDLDGTLLDSLGVQLESYRLAIIEFGGRHYTDDEILDSFVLGPAANMLATLIGRPVGDEAVRRYMAHLREGASRASAYEGIAELLSALASRFPLGVFTAATTSAAELLLEAAGIRASFEVVVGADRVPRTKPAPDGLILACRTMGVDPRKAAYVGDGPSDMAIARACGALGIAAGWGQQYAAGREGDLTAASPGQLVRILMPDLA